LIYKKEVELCAGEMCKQNEKHAIQKVSRLQIFSLCSYILLLLLAMFFLNNYFHNQPKNLLEIMKIKKTASVHNTILFQP